MYLKSPPLKVAQVHFQLHFQVHFHQGLNLLLKINLVNSFSTKRFPKNLTKVVKNQLKILKRNKKYEETLSAFFTSIRDYLILAIYVIILLTKVVCSMIEAFVSITHLPPRLNHWSAPMKNVPGVPGKSQIISDTSPHVPEDFWEKKIHQIHLYLKMYLKVYLSYLRAIFLDIFRGHVPENVSEKCIWAT